MKSLRNSLTVNVISASAVLEPDCSVWPWKTVAMTRNACASMTGVTQQIAVIGGAQPPRGADCLTGERGGGVSDRTARFIVSVGSTSGWARREVLRVLGGAARE
jgi:hypothetical protein